MSEPHSERHFHGLMYIDRIVNDFLPEPLKRDRLAWAEPVKGGYASTAGLFLVGNVREEKFSIHGLVTPFGFFDLGKVLEPRAQEAFMATTKWSLFDVSSKVHFYDYKDGDFCLKNKGLASEQQGKIYFVNSLNGKIVTDPSIRIKCFFPKYSFFRTSPHSLKINDYIDYLLRDDVSIFGGCNLG